MPSTHSASQQRGAYYCLSREAAAWEGYRYRWKAVHWACAALDEVSDGPPEASDALVRVNSRWTRFVGPKAFGTSGEDAAAEEEMETRFAGCGMTTELFLKMQRQKLGLPKGMALNAHTAPDCPL